MIIIQCRLLFSCQSDNNEFNLKSVFWSQKFLVTNRLQQKYFFFVFVFCVATKHEHLYIRLKEKPNKFELNERKM